MLKSSAGLLVLMSAIHARALPEAISNLRVLFRKLVPTLLPGIFDIFFFAISYAFVLPYYAGIIP